MNACAYLVMQVLCIIYGAIGGILAAKAGIVKSWQASIYIIFWPVSFNPKTAKLLCFLGVHDYHITTMDFKDYLYECHRCGKRVGI